ncbi:MAG TPA: nucleotide exchange factor GrpE [Nitrososphaeraceae archaeon]|nr:nucleotide exchange factor GrpE [Nitrososphaeraceae archaeon]
MINNDNSIKKGEKQTTDNISESLKEEEELKKTKIELKETKKAAEMNLNKLKYMIADFDNYRKQIEKQMASNIESNKANLLSRFLTIRDDYERALDMIKKNKDLDEVFINGLDGIFKNLDNILRSEGVIPIETIGKMFDSNKHDVISFAYNDDLPENTITNEIRRGYMLNDKVLRASLVEISKKKKKLMNNNIDESN